MGLRSLIGNVYATIVVFYMLSKTTGHGQAKIKQYMNLVLREKCMVE